MGDEAHEAHTGRALRRDVRDISDYSIASRPASQPAHAQNEAGKNNSEKSLRS